MRMIEIIKRVLEAIPFILDILLLFLLVAVSAYGAIKAVLEVPDFVKDQWDKLRKRDYRVKSTILKAIIADNQTQIIKLRNVRVHTRRERLELDPVPVYGPGPAAQDHQAQVQPTHYSVPGRSLVVPRDGGNKFQIDFLPDEAEHLSPHRDHPILLSYFLDEKVNTLFNPPGVVAIQPVGSERLTIDVYFPPMRRLKDGTAKVRTVDHEGNQIEVLKEKHTQVQKYRYNFGDGRGDIDFIRAVITKPPQELNIEFYWQWELTTDNPTSGAQLPAPRETRITQ